MDDYFSHGFFIPECTPRTKLSERAKGTHSKMPSFNTVSPMTACVNDEKSRLPARYRSVSCMLCFSSGEHLITTVGVLHDYKVLGEAGSDRVSKRVHVVGRRRRGRCDHHDTHALVGIARGEISDELPQRLLATRWQSFALVTRKRESSRANVFYAVVPALDCFRTAIGIRLP